MQQHRILALGLSLAVLAGCNVHAPAATTKPHGTTTTTAVASASPSQKPGMPPPLTVLTPAPGTAVPELTGKVKLLLAQASSGADPIVTNNGGSIISDNGSGIVSNHGGNVVANNGGGLVANNAGNMRLLAANPLTEFGLADATVELLDAAGQPVQDAAGKPITAVTDKDGNYTLAANLPAKVLVLRVKLWQGGELSALLPKDGASKRQQAINTSSTLGASYVLAKYVQANQDTLDRLPGVEADKLQADLDAARPLIVNAPTYKPDDSVQLADGLRAQAPGLDRTFAEIKALLLGEANLGNGRQATTVPVFDPRGLQVDSKGLLYLGEPGLGRIRTVDPNGTLSTFADVLRGTVKHNFPDLHDMVLTPDGGMYVALEHQVVRLGADHKVTLVAGAETTVVGQPTPRPEDATHPLRLALGPDGTLYIGEQADDPERDTHPPRVLMLKPGGQLTQLTIDPTWVMPGVVCGLTTSADGTLYVLEHGADNHKATLYKRKPDGSVNTIADDLWVADIQGGVAVAKDGTIYVSESGGGRVTAFLPDGSRKVVAGDGGPAATAGLSRPGAITVGPDGTLFIADVNRSLVHTLAPDGGWRDITGAGGAVGSDLSNLPLNTPRAGVFMPDGSLIVTEQGGNRLARFDGVSLSTYAGGRLGADGDGGAAIAAALAGPGPIAVYKGEVYFGEHGTFRIRKIAADGTISTVVGHPEGDKPLLAGQRPLAKDFSVDAEGIAISPDGQLYFSSLNSAQIYRLSADGYIELVAGGTTLTTYQSMTDAFAKVGPALEATAPAKDALLGAPSALAFDGQGNLFVADLSGQLVRKISGLKTGTPTISKVAGVSALDHIIDGVNAPSVADVNTTLVSPVSVAVAPDGTVYEGEVGTAALPLFTSVSDDTMNSLLPQFGLSYARIRKITPDGKVTIIAGPGGRVFTDPQAADALVIPSGLALSADGRLAIFDSGANLLRILPAGTF